MSFTYRSMLPLCVLFLGVLNARAGVAPTNSAVVERPPVAPGLVFPVTVSTNAQGGVVHHFSTTPTITNRVTATNDLARLKAQQADLEAELKKVSEEEGGCRKAMRANFQDIVGVMTNFAARNPDGGKLQDRIQTLETELKALKQEFQSKLEQDEAYKQARSKVDQDRKSMMSFQEKLGDLRKKQLEVGAKVWQLQTVVSQDADAEARKQAGADAEQQAESGKKVQETSTGITP